MGKGRKKEDCNKKKRRENQKKPTRKTKAKNRSFKSTLMWNNNILLGVEWEVSEYWC